MQAIYAHKDGNQFPAIICKEKDDRISVMISSVNNEQLLEVPTLNPEAPIYGRNVYLPFYVFLYLPLIIIKC